MLIATGGALAIVFWDRLAELVHGGRPVPVDEVRFLGSLAAGLRAGASVRHAIAAASAGETDASVLRARRLALAGAPLDEVALAIEALPTNGQRTGAALRVVARAGGRAAEVFDALAASALETEKRMRERRALTTQVRLSAVVVGGLPLLSILVGGWGRIASLITSGTGGLVVAAVGVGMQAVGIAAVWRMARQ